MYPIIMVLQDTLELFRIFDERLSDVNKDSLDLFGKLTVKPRMPHKPKLYKAQPTPARLRQLMCLRQSSRVSHPVCSPVPVLGTRLKKLWGSA